MRLFIFTCFLFSFNLLASEPIQEMIESRQFNKLNTYLEAKSNISKKEALDALGLMSKKSLISVEFIDLETIQRLREFLF